MIRVSVTIDRWDLVEAFEIARGTITDLSVVVVTLEDNEGRRGWAEAAGVDYDGETPNAIAAQIESAIPALQASMPDGIVTPSSMLAVQQMLPLGGARNALDCAMWDLRAKQSGIPAWQAAGLPPMHPITTVFTLGLGSEDVTRRKAREARKYPILKLKCDRDRNVDVVRWVREEHPQARISVDANQSWDRDLLEKILPELVTLGVEMVEQPVKRYEDAQLEGIVSPLPLAADESCTDLKSIAKLASIYQFINIKLDKSGGLTEALRMSDEAERRGMKLMVGNMCGTSLGMAPGFIIGQRCGYVDLDGPLLQKLDRAHAMPCVDGVMQPPTPALWG
jgi:L-alanine-DL-glutamate epimerase-like enolase superfamily enzyme